MLDPKDFQFMYGTAWKEDATAELTYLALQSGFVAIDTANQRKHYFEQGVGSGLSQYLSDTGAKRENLFIQTKYTYERGQDHRLPYDPQADFATQVQQSFDSSLNNLGIETIDSYVLHGPFLPDRFGDQDQETWTAMEELAKAGKTRFLGASNVSPAHLTQLLEFASIRPKFVQNRCFASLRWDQAIRDICEQNDIIYQGFSLLTANQVELSQPEIVEIANGHGKTLPQIVFRFAIQEGMLPLTGTTNQSHMKLDLNVHDFTLSEEELGQIRGIGL